MAKRPNTSTAVMARRRGKDDNEGLTDEEKLWKTLDLFATPPWGARAGLEHAAQLWPDARQLMEPAAGLGHIARPALDHFPLVATFDVHDHGPGYEQRDWLGSDWPTQPMCDITVTNPPFSIAEEFVLRGLERSRLGVALLLRLPFLEGGERHSILAGPRATLTQVVTFSERLPMTLGSWDPEASSAAAYAWFFWSKIHEPLPPAWFPPGTRDRLWRKDDPQHFGKLNPLPLFPDDFDVL